MILKKLLASKKEMVSKILEYHYQSKFIPNREIAHKLGITQDEVAKYRPMSNNAAVNQKRTKVMNEHTKQEITIRYNKRLAEAFKELV